MMQAGRRAAALAVLGGILVALVGLGIFVLRNNDLPLDHDSRVRLYVASACLGGLLWLLAVVLVRRGGLPRYCFWLVLAFAVAMRAITFVSPPLLSSDVYRYVWDGRVQLAGINPYRYLPAAPELAFLRDEAVYPNINRADYAPTIYPPAAQVIFLLAAVVTPGVVGMKAVMTGFDVTAIIILEYLLRLIGRDRAEVLIYAWLPLPIWEFVGNGHIDAAAAGLLAVALLFAARNAAARSGVALAAAALTKILPMAVLPAFWRFGRWRLLSAFLLTSVLLYLPYVTVGKQALGFLGGYLQEEHISRGGGPFLFEALHHVVPLPSWSLTVYFSVAVAILFALAVRFAFGGRLSLAPAERVTTIARQSAILGAVLLVAISPHYQWYFGWLAPLACLTPLASVLWLLAAAPLLALGPIEHLMIPTTVYLPAAALAVLDFHRSRTTAAPIPTYAAGSA